MLIRGRSSCPADRVEGADRVVPSRAPDRLLLAPRLASRPSRRRVPVSCRHVSPVSGPAHGIGSRATSVGDYLATLARDPLRRFRCSASSGQTLRLPFPQVCSDGCIDGWRRPRRVAGTKGGRRRWSWLHGRRRCRRLRRGQADWMQVAGPPQRASVTTARARLPWPAEASKRRGGPAARNVPAPTAAVTAPASHRRRPSAARRRGRPSPRRARCRRGRTRSNLRRGVSALASWGPPRRLVHAAAVSRDVVCAQARQPTDSRACRLVGRAR